MFIHTSKREKIKYLILLLCFIITIVVGLLVIRALPMESTPSQELSVYNMDLDFTVTEVKQGLFNLKVGVYNADIDVAKTFVLTGSDAERFRDVQVGDTVTGYMYFWTNGEMIVDWVVLLYEVF